MTKNRKYMDFLIAIILAVGLIVQGCIRTSLQLDPNANPSGQGGNSGSSSGKSCSEELMTKVTLDDNGLWNNKTKDPQWLITESGQKYQELVLCICANNTASCSSNEISNSDKFSKDAGIPTNIVHLSLKEACPVNFLNENLIDACSASKDIHFQLDMCQKEFLACHND